jgi:NTE family protein
MIRQNSILMERLMKPNILIDIQMSSYGGFDYDKSERIVNLGKKKTDLAISQFEGK